MALRTVIYLRKSTKDKDEKQILSIPRQRSEVMDFVKTYNATQKPSKQLKFNPKKDIFFEDASGKIVQKENRPRFHAMVSEIKKYKYDVLLCTELSRLSRNAVDSGTLVQLLEIDEKRNKSPLLKIRTLDSVFEPTPTSKFTLSLFLSVAKFENDQRAVNTASGMDRQKEKGETTHRATVGYLNVGEKKGQKKVIKHPENWDKTRELWEDMLTGECSVADIWHKAKYELKLLHMWNDKLRVPSPTTFRDMFRNRYYLGEVKRKNKKTGEVTWVNEDKHPAMVTEPEFEKVQIILQSQGYKHQHITKEVSIEGILNEILLCGKCKTEKNSIQKPTKMIFEKKVRYTCTRCKHRYASAERKPCPKCETPITADSKTDVHRMYRCGKKHSSQACSHDFYGDGKPKKNLQADKIEQFLDEKISTLHITDELFEVLRRQLYTLWLEDNKKLRDERKKLKEQIDKLEEERLEMQKKLLFGDKEKSLTQIEREDTEALMEINMQEQDTKTQEKEELDEKIEENFEKAWQTLQALREAKSVFGSPALGIEPKRRLILSMVSNLKITDNKWDIEWKKPFNILAKATIAKKGKPKSGTGLKGAEFDWLLGLDSNQ